MKDITEAYKRLIDAQAPEEDRLDRLADWAEDRMTLDEVMAKPPPEPGKTPAQDRMTAVTHLLDGATTNAQHTTRHFLRVKAITGAGDDERLDYHVEHLEDHLAETLDHLIRLKAALVEYFPEIGTEMDQLHAVTDPASRAYERGAADVRKRWRGDLMYDDDADASARAAYDSSRGMGSY